MPAYGMPISAALHREVPWMIPTRAAAMHAGDAMRLLFTIYNRDGDATPLNLQGTKSRFWLRLNGISCPAIHRPVFAVNFEGGQIAVDFTSAETARMAGRGEWGLTVGFAGGMTTVSRGVLNILPNHLLPTDETGGALAGALITQLREPFEADTEGTYISYME